MKAEITEMILEAVDTVMKDSTDLLKEAILDEISLAQKAEHECPVEKIREIWK